MVVVLFGMFTLLLLHQEQQKFHHLLHPLQLRTYVVERVLGLHLYHDDFYTTFLSLERSLANMMELTLIPKLKSLMNFIMMEDMLVLHSMGRVM